MSDRETMGKLHVDTALIESLAELLQRTGLTEIELAEGDSRLRVVRAAQTVVTSMATAPVASHLAPPAPAAAAETRRPSAEGHPGAVYAPMVGTVYLTPEPGAAPFVVAGDEVRDGQTLLIIEAMKVMNPIRAPRAGRIVEVAVGNGDPVEFGELLLIIE